ncbi:MAG: hypothetical protein HY400_05290 [Elusimicrobia bacterium]|nr:hypothetical protein [Elusimicrobiota bacterium]
MGIKSKWIFWFTCIGIYVMFLGGIFYYNLFKWTFDEKLKSESIEMVRVYAPTLLKGLQRNLRAVTLDELDIMAALSKDDRVTSLLYLNKYGEIRWHKDASLLALSFDEYRKRVGVPTNVIEQAYLSKSPKVKAIPNQSAYDIAIPLSVRGEVIGIANVQISREKAEKIIQSAMGKYVIGAIGVLFLMGIPLFFFLNHFVLGPLSALRDAIETISLKGLDLKFASRKDEIGELAEVVRLFLHKVKGELSGVQGKETQREAAEQHWWDKLIAAIVGSHQKAIVVDEDNNVLHTNFPLRAPVSASTKLHLLDVVDSQQQDLLRLVGMALDRPNELVEGETVFKAEPCHVRILHLKGQGDIKRTLILFEPKRITSTQRR